jgi:hypothetical protein
MEDDVVQPVSSIEILFTVAVGVLLLEPIFGLLFITGLVLHVEHAQRKESPEETKPIQDESYAGHSVIVSPVIR